MKIDKRKKYMAAISGGPDSMALLHKYSKYIVCVCHVNYHKRLDSYRDIEIVKEFCDKMSIPLEVYDVERKQYINSEINNFQALARKIRYEFFLKCSQKYKCKNILIAHNLNDFIETAIMQYNRNSLNFYYGIKAKSKYKSLTIYRPLIDVFKVDIEKYCNKNGISYAIDWTNASDLYERNRVRHQLSKKSKKELLELYEEINARNREIAKKEKKTRRLLSRWRKSGYSLKFIQKTVINDSFVYLYLQKIHLKTINHNKIRSVKQFLKSSKGNVELRLQDDLSLKKHKGKAIVIRKEK